MAKSSPLRRLGATPVTAWWLAYHSVVLVLWYTSAWLVLGTTLLPGGAGFALCVVYLAAALGGRLVRLLSSRLPPLLGMLLAGLVMGNSSPAILATIKEPLFLGHDFSWWSAVLRTTALAIIMLRAGLGLNLDKLRKMGFATARLAFMPCLLEATVVGLLAAAVLGFPPAWGGLLGFVVAAVSPAVVVPGMLDLQARRLGTGKGIPTLVMAAASFDDVISIAGFGICLALALSDGSQSLLWLVFKAPVEIFAGVGIGASLAGKSGPNPGSLPPSRGPGAWLSFSPHIDPAHSVDADCRHRLRLLGGGSFSAATGCDHAYALRPRRLAALSFWRQGAPILRGRGIRCGGTRGCGGNMVATGSSCLRAGRHQ